MIETLVGKNLFMLDDTVKRRVRDFSHEYDALGLERYDASEVDAQILIDAILNLPFLITKKLVIISNPSANKQFSEALPTVIERLPEENHVLLVDPAIDKRTSFFTFLKKQTNLLEFAELDSFALVQWLVDRAQQYQFTIDTSAAKFLVERVGPNQLLLDQELKKLGLFAPAITKENISLLTEQAPQSKIFDLLDAFLSASPKRTIELYRDQRAQRVEPIYILNMIVWQLHNVALAVYARPQTEQTLVAAGLSPYTARNALRLGKSVSKHDIRQIIADLVLVDKQIKTSADPDHALELFLLKRTISSS